MLYIFQHCENDLAGWRTLCEECMHYDEVQRLCTFGTYTLSKSPQEMLMPTRYITRREACFAFDRCSTADTACPGARRWNVY